MGTMAIIGSMGTGSGGCYWYQGFFFSRFFHGGKKLKMLRRLRRACYAFGVRRLSLLNFRQGGFFSMWVKKNSKILWGEFSPSSGEKSKTLMGTMGTEGTMGTGKGVLYGLAVPAWSSV